MSNTLTPDQQIAAAEQIRRSKMEQANSDRRLQDSYLSGVNRTHNTNDPQEIKKQIAENERANRQLAKQPQDWRKKIITKAGMSKIKQGKDTIFWVLLLIALLLDILEYLDLGSFSVLVDILVYILVVTTGFVVWFLKSNEEFGIFNLLKNQLWKYAILPLFEWIPFVSLLPFWTGTVVLMWLKVKTKRRLMYGKKKDI